MRVTIETTVRKAPNPLAFAVVVSTGADVAATAVTGAVVVGTTVGGVVTTVVGSVVGRGVFWVLEVCTAFDCVGVTVAGTFADIRGFCS